MNDPKILGKTFQRYLQSGLETGAAREMCRVLDHSGLQNESKALAAYLELKTASSSGFVETKWDRRKCYAGPLLPPNPEIDDVWFDVVELTPMILINADISPSLPRATWLSMHPVQLWQFQGFLGSVKVGQSLIEFPSAPDYLSAARFEGGNPTGIVTDVYHDEGLAYAHWFSKYMCDYTELRGARLLLDDAEFSLILPPGIRLWDEVDLPADEFVRVAYGKDTLDKEDLYAEYLLRDTGENKSLPDRALFEEWERRAEIGFLTSVDLNIGLIKKVRQPSRTIYFKLLNAAPR